MYFANRLQRWFGTNYSRAKRSPLLILSQLFTVRTFSSPLCTVADPRRFRQKVTGKETATPTLAAGASALAPSSPPVRTEVMQAEERRRRWRRRGAAEARLRSNWTSLTWLSVGQCARSVRRQFLLSVTCCCTEGWRVSHQTADWVIVCIGKLNGWLKI